MGGWVFMSTPRRQFDYLHPNRPKFKYLMFAVQLLPALLYIISTNRVQNKGRSIEATFVHVKIPVNLCSRIATFFCDKTSHIL